MWNKVSNNRSSNLYFSHFWFFSIRDCAHDLIRDISDFVFEELVKYKLYDNANHNQRTNVDEPISSMDDGENENKYQIELAESESRPLNLYVEYKFYFH